MYVIERTTSRGRKINVQRSLLGINMLYRCRDERARTGRLNDVDRTQQSIRISNGLTFAVTLASLVTE